MNTHEILKVLQEDIHTVIIATTDQKGYPYTCAIDMMLLEDESLYFLTARGKAFYNRLMKQSHIALTGLKGEDTMSSVAISLQGTVKNIGHERLDEIFEKNPYMKEIYPERYRIHIQNKGISYYYLFAGPKNRKNRRKDTKTDANYKRNRSRFQNQCSDRVCLRLYIRGTFLEQLHR